jgi:hypothetical protein
MKRFIYLIAAASMLLSSCLKNNVTRKYTIYTPIYETKGEVYAKIKDAVEHNRRLIVEKDWYNDFRQQLNSVIGHTTAD